MPGFTERTVNYRVDVVSPNDFSDGRIRVEPPIQASDEFWGELIGDESDVQFYYVVSGREATLASFAMNDVESRHIPSNDNEARIRFAVGKLLAELAAIESVEIFKSNGE